MIKNKYSTIAPQLVIDNHYNLHNRSYFTMVTLCVNLLHPLNVTVEVIYDHDVYRITS